jgi:hypothetical protein
LLAVAVALPASVVGSSCSSSRVCHDPTPSPGVTCGDTTCQGATPVCCTQLQPSGYDPPFATLSGTCAARAEDCGAGTGAHVCDEPTDCPAGQKCCFQLYAPTTSTCADDCGPSFADGARNPVFQACHEDCECGATGWCERAGDWKNFCCLPEGAICSVSRSGPAGHLCCSKNCVIDFPDNPGSDSHCR